MDPDAIASALQLSDDPSSEFTGAFPAAIGGVPRFVEICLAVGKSVPTATTVFYLGVPYDQIDNAYGALNLGAVFKTRRFYVWKPSPPPPAATAGMPANVAVTNSPVFMEIKFFSCDDMPSGPTSLTAALIVANPPAAYAAGHVDFCLRTTPYEVQYILDEYIKVTLIASVQPVALAIPATFAGAGAAFAALAAVAATTRPYTIAAALGMVPTPIQAIDLEERFDDMMVSITADTVAALPAAPAGLTRAQYMRNQFNARSAGLILANSHIVELRTSNPARVVFLTSVWGHVDIVTV